MKVRDLIKKLSQFDDDKEVYITHPGNDGCETCGYGASEVESNDFTVVDMESKVWLSIS